jgi:NhaC family Na+:H+ antiporter
MKQETVRPPSLFHSLIPVLFLIGMLAASVYLFGDSSSRGPTQIALILSAGIGIIIGIANGYTWKQLESGIVTGISLAMGAMLILLMVGSLIGSWILAGVVPSMIYYGLGILNPTVFFAAACVICCITSLATGSSWTTAGTVGVALVGIAAAQGLHLGIAAGAIVSGAYFGDKMSPLSDTTNLAPAMAGTDLFTHIRHMAWTTTPSIVLALIIFTVIGLRSAAPADTSSVEAIRQAIAAQFAVGPHLLIPLAIVLALVIGRMPALPALMIGALVGCVFAVIFQRAAVLAYVGQPDANTGVALVKGAWTSLFDGFKLESGNKALDDLLSRGGMASMLPTVWLIIAAMMFGAVMETTGMLQRIAAVDSERSPRHRQPHRGHTCDRLQHERRRLRSVHRHRPPGRMFAPEFQRRGLHPKNLSRALEDGGTMTSALVPWNTCGAFMAQTLGVATFAYAPFAFFNLINPLISAVYGFTGFTIEKLKPGEEALPVQPLPEV